MTGKQVIRACERVVRALEEVEAAIERGEREDSDDEKPAFNFDPPVDKYDIAEMISDMYRHLEEVREQMDATRKESRHD